MLDPNDAWDDRPGFNKRGPRIFHWITEDKIDDNRGIPHIGMNYLIKVIKSPHMFKKPEITTLSNLTGHVLKNIAKLDFNNDYNKVLNDFPTYD